MTVYPDQGEKGTFTLIVEFNLTYNNIKTKKKRQLFYVLIFSFSFSLFRPSGPNIENSTVIDELHSITISMQSSDQTDKRKD